MQCRAVRGPCLYLDFSSLLVRFPHPLGQRKEELGQGKLGMRIQPLPSLSLELREGLQPDTRRGIPQESVTIPPKLPTREQLR